MRISDEEARERLEQLKRFLDPCKLCPRLCGVHRLSGQIGVCKAGDQIRVASWAPHRGEEPAISGTRGSGTIFVSFCQMKCAFCQNFPFSQAGNGTNFSNEELVQIFVKLISQKVHNLNFVSPTHFLVNLLQAYLDLPKELPRIPIVYNSSGYENLEILRLLDGIIDIYLPDIKYSNNESALRFSKAPNYVEINRAAITEMHRQVGPLIVDNHGIALQGLIVRHLVLPNDLAGTSFSLIWLKETIGLNVHLSLMSQYFPSYMAPEIPELNRKITYEEYLRALDIVEELELENVWAQDPTLVGFA